MAKGPRYRVSLKRRKKNVTNYRKRKVMSMSKKLRFTIRPSLRNMLIQIIQANPKGDIILATAHSNELNKFGWKAPRGNTPASYLTGLLMGLKARSIDIIQVTPDIGLKTPSIGSRIFAAIKGATDAKLKIPYGNVLPDSSRIRGEHIASYSEKLAELNIELYKKTFSNYLNQNLRPNQLPAHFENVKTNIVKTCARLAEKEK